MICPNCNTSLSFKKINVITAEKIYVDTKESLVHQINFITMD